MKKLLIVIAISFWVVILALVAAALFFTLSGFQAPGWLSWLPGVEGEGNMFGFQGTVSLHSEESCPAADISTLRLAARYQDIRVSLSDGDEVVLRHYDYEGAPDWMLSQSGTELSVHIDMDFASIGIMGFGSLGNPPRLEVELPRSLSLSVDLSAASGTVQISGAPDWESVSLQASSGSVQAEGGIHCGALTAKTTSGSIRFGDITASSASLGTSSGGLHTGRIETAEALALQSTSGGIRTGDIRAGRVQADSSSGSIIIGRIDSGGAVYLGSTSGRIETGGINGASLEASASSGSQSYGEIKVSGTAAIQGKSGGITIGGLDCARFDIGSGSGTLRLHGDTAGSGLIESRSGSVTLERFTLRGDTGISAASGSVRVTMASGQSYRLEASCSSGSIRADGISLQYRDDRGKQAFATAGTGGDLLTLGTTSGSIRLK